MTSFRSLSTDNKNRRKKQKHNVLAFALDHKKKKMSSGLYVQTDEVGVRYTGVTVQVPDNDVARLMYYLNCVCTAINCEQDSIIRRFTAYEFWVYLSADDQRALLNLCCELSPDVFEGKVFFCNELLSGDSLNDFLEISQVRQQIVAANSIVIAGRTCEVNKIMIYKMRWMRQNYTEPIQSLRARLDAVNRRAINYTAPSTPPPSRAPRPRSDSASLSTPLLHRSHDRGDRSSSCGTRACVIGVACGLIFVFVFILTGVIFYLLEK